MTAGTLQALGPTLGCASRYTAALMPRGGDAAGPALGVFDSVVSVEWDRTVDNPSECKLVVGLQQAGAGCCQAVAQTEKWATELHVYRHTDAGAKKVWEGPVVNKDESLQTGQFTVIAYDVLEWMKVRVNHTDLVFPQGLDAAALVAYMIADGFMPDDPNVVEHMVLALAGGPLITDNTPAESVNIWSHMSQILQSQVDLTTVGRRIVVMGEGASPWTKTITLGPDDIAGDVSIGDDGTDYANRLIVAGSGVSRTGKRTKHKQIVQDDPTLPIAAGDQDDDYHGLVEHLVKMNQITTRSEAWGAASTLLTFSDQTGYVRAADGAQLLPSAHVSIEDLVCGTQVHIVPAPQFCTPLPPEAVFSLQHVAVTYTPDVGEKVGIGVGVANQIAAQRLQQAG